MPGRTPGTLDDASDLAGETVDVAARIAWLARMARTTAPGSPSLQELAELTGASVARLQRLETGAARDGRLLDAYEQALGLGAGSLRAPVDITCRTFPAVSPRDLRSGSAVTTVRALSELTERLLAAVRDGVAADAGTWITWARALAAPGAIGLPESLAHELVVALVRELARSVGPAYPVRYEALALLRCSAYGEVVVRVARDEVADPHVQVLWDLMSAVSEAVSEDAVAWCLDLLGDPRERVVIGAVLALENLGAVTPDPDAFWERLVGPLVEVHNAAADGSVTWTWMSHLLRVVPPRVLTGHPARVTRPLAPREAVSDWSTSALNRHWSECRARADAICAEVGVAPQPMLARLLFDLAISGPETRGVTSYMLLGALPAVVPHVAAHVAELATSHEDDVIRDRARRRLRGACWGLLPDLYRLPLPEDGDPACRADALALTGAAGLAADDDEYRRVLADPAARWSATYALGMAGHPMLEELAAGPGADELAGAARWWRRTGVRLTH